VIQRARVSILILAAGLALGIHRSPAAAQAPPALDAALDWLAGQQAPDGGFSNGFAPQSDPGATADAMLAALSGGIRPSEWTVEGLTALDFLEQVVREGDVSGPGQAAKIALTVEAAGLDARAFGGADLIAQVLGGYDPQSGLFGSGPYDSGLAVLALDASGEALPPGALEGLVRLRVPDGSFSFSGDQTPGAGDSNTTAIIVQALLAAGAAEQVGPSLAYFRAVQNPDGGWTYQKPSAFGEETDANSTALVIQALLAAGEDLTDWGDPLQALAALQRPSGAFAFNRANDTDNILATIQAIPALAGTHLVEVPDLAERLQDEPAPTPFNARLALAVGALLLIVLLVAAMAGRSAGRPSKE